MAKDASVDVLDRLAAEIETARQRMKEAEASGDLRWLYFASGYWAGLCWVEERLKK